MYPGAAFNKVEDLEEMVSGLPKVSGSRLLVSIYKDPSSFLDLAERGIFVRTSEIECRWEPLGQL